MRPSKIRALSVLLGACYCLFIGAPSMADDTEIFGGGGAVASGLKPNILFIVDTSGSMDTLVETINIPFDPATTYPAMGTCDKNYVYWIRDTGAEPDCGTTQKFPLTQLKCKSALNSFALGGQYIAFKAGMYNSTAGRIRWENLRAGVNNEFVECQADLSLSPKDGNTPDSTKPYACNGTGAGCSSGKWTATAANAITWTSNNTNWTYTLYSGNYLNWFNDPVNRTLKSRLQIVKDVATSLANSIDNVNLGVMRYSNNGGVGETAAEGGMVVQPVTDISTSRAGVISSINAFLPDGFTPLSETLYEAGQYFAGRPVDFGLTSRVDPATPFPSVAASRQAGNQALYQSPIQYSCQKNFVVYLTDGLPTEDNNADSKITALPNYQSLLGTNTCDDTGPGRCLDDMAEYLFKADLNSNLPGQQNVVTYTIGFGPEVSGSTFLQKVAQRGGGQAYSADDTSSLAQVLSGIVANIVQTNTTFTSPSVSVNAFNRTQTLDDIYVSLFKPSEDYHWPGNVKKYKVANGIIVDKNGNPAIDPATGFFAATSQGLWSASGADGSSVVVGGAANQLPAPAVRKLYTYLGSNTALADVSNAVVSTNAGITDAMLGLGSPGQPVHADLIDWMRGRDVTDENNNGDFNETRFVMGDPIHAKPAIVIYGGTAASPDVNDAVVYSVTNDGYLHAFDVTTGQELWSFVPRELLATMPALFDDATSVDKHYALDGDLRVFKIDRNSNGVVEPANGDKVYLFFGMRRGGSNYYALDITAKSAPVFKWVIGTGSLPGVGETWSTPAVAKVNISGATQNADKSVLIFGGGYNDSQDNSPYSTDSIGNRIYMIDAYSGALLWYASGATIGSPAPNLDLSSGSSIMSNSFPSDVLVLDMDQDGYADRMYAADMGGRLWRFDIQNGQPAGNLVHGGIIARLGDGDRGTVTTVDARRLYSTPDAAIVRDRGINPYLALALGSGYRGHPLNTTIRDRFYMIKDKVPFTTYTTQAAFAAQFNSTTIATDTGTTPATDVQDVTDSLSATVPAAALGWKLELREGASTWIGEKSLSGASIFNNRVFFTTYTPQTVAPVDPCTPGQGTNRAYVVSLLNGSPVADLDGQVSVNRADRYKQLKQGGIAPEVVFLFPGNNNTSSSGPGGPGGPGSGGTTGTRGLLCLSGVEVLAGVCVNAGAAVRTFWQEQGTN